MEVNRVTVYSVLTGTLFLVIQMSDVAKCYKFNRQTSGVIFSPYVKHMENGVFPSNVSYSLENVKTMLEVVSTKFTKILTLDRLSNSDFYAPNYTYYNAESIIYTAEAAALINRDRNKSSLTYTMGIKFHDEEQMMETEIRLAFEAAQKANKIFKGTVEGFHWTISFYSKRIEGANKTLKGIKTLRKDATRSGLKLGVHLYYCDEYKDALKNSKFNAINLIIGRILDECDYVICFARINDYSIRPKDNALLVEKALLDTRNVFQKHHSNLEIMGLVYWPTDDLKGFYNIDNMQKFWEGVNSFASAHNFPIWFTCAIDNPWRQPQNDFNCGWWRLTSNSKVNLREGYIERVLERDVDFSRKLVGVRFSPYIRQNENDKIQSSSTELVKTMLKVVSNKFNKILTCGGLSNSVKYNRIALSYHDTLDDSYSAQAAAMINKERNKTLLTIYIEISLNSDPQVIETETKLALEAVTKANEIYPGTAVALVWNFDSTVGEFQPILNMIKDKCMVAKSKGLKRGIRLEDCVQYHDVLKNSKMTQTSSDLYSLLNDTEFVICNVNSTHRNEGPKSSFGRVRTQFLSFRKTISKIHENLEVMGETTWGNVEPIVLTNIDDLRGYWKFANEFALEYNFTLWLREAFDNPWKGYSSAHTGWWRRASDSDIYSETGYTEDALEIHPNAANLSEIQKQEMEKAQSTAEFMEKWDELAVVIGNALNKSTDKSTTESLPISSSSSEKPNYKATDKNTSTWIYVGNATAVAIFLILVVVSIILEVYMKRSKNALTKQDVQDFIKGKHDAPGCPAEDGTAIQSAIKLPYDTSYEIPKHQLKINYDALLGTGQFGCVFKAKIERETAVTEVALKMAKANCPTSALNGLLSEIKILIYLRKHQNIACIQGAYTAELMRGVVYIATELCELGSLKSYLQNGTFKTRRVQENDDVLKYANVDNEVISCTTKPEITVVDMAKWSYEIACAMEYLGTKHVVHADLATRNVLLTSDKTAKITDFGLSRRLYDYMNYVKKQQEPLPWRWMSIESLKRLEFSAKSDVWSYGVTLWEIFSMGDVPYAGLTWDFAFVENLINGLRLNNPQHGTPEICRKMEDCWKMEPHARPTFVELKIFMEVILNILDKNHNALHH